MLLGPVFYQTLESPTSVNHFSPSVLHLLLISQTLSSLTVTRLRDLTKCVFFYVLQYISLSKRLVPEAINFLCGILFLGSSKEGRTRK